MANNEVFEYRGVQDAVIAEVLTDDNEEGSGYTTGPVMSLVPVAEIGKTVEVTSEPHYYDNRAALIIKGEGPDEITITGAGMLLERYALVAGRHFDKATGAMVEGPHKTRYFALGYKTQDTNGHDRYVWRYKGTFAVPEDSHSTQNDGTEATGTTLVYSGIYTNHKFTKGEYDGSTWTAAPVKGLVVDVGLGLADVSTFFDTVTTPDALKAKSAA